VEGEVRWSGRGGEVSEAGQDLVGEFRGVEDKPEMFAVEAEVEMLGKREGRPADQGVGYVLAGNFFRNAEARRKA
jgi:hypothetical protein